MKTDTFTWSVWIYWFCWIFRMAPPTTLGVIDELYGLFLIFDIICLGINHYFFNIFFNDIVTELPSSVNFIHISFGITFCFFVGALFNIFFNDIDQICRLRWISFISTSGSPTSQPCLVIFCAKKCSTNSAENCAEGECGSETECCVGAECPAGTKCQMQKCTQQTRPKIALKVNVTLKLNVALELNIKLKVNVKHAKLYDDQWRQTEWKLTSAMRLFDHEKWDFQDF